MVVSYTDLAKKIITLVGGPSNVRSLTNCVTRLRLSLDDMNIPDDDSIRQIDGIKGIVRRDDEYQIIIGPEVFRLAEELRRMDQVICDLHEGEYSEKHTPDNIFIRPVLDKIEITAPLQGRIMPLAELSDFAFASGNLGEGIVILPEEGKVVSPCEATVSVTMDSSHAIELCAYSGADILIHVGVNTNHLDGEYFHCHVNMGDHVIPGDLLISFDIEKLKADGYDIHTPVIITNSEDFVIVRFTCKDHVFVGDVLMTII
jgi:glucose-specific phosphotransferase system IIA component